MEAPDYQVGAHFEALDEGVLVAAFKSTGYFFPISISPVCIGQAFMLCDLGVLACAQKLRFLEF